MPIRNRIIFFVVLLFSAWCVAFSSMIMTLPRNLSNSIDRTLDRWVVEMVEEATTADKRVQLDQIEWPSDVDELEAATSFYVVLTPDGEIVGRSENWNRSLPLYSGFELGETDLHNVTFDDNLLRVINIPILGEFEDETRLIGTIQVGQLINGLARFYQLGSASVLLGIAAFAGSVFIIALVLPMILRPLSDIADVAAQITTADDLTIRIDREHRPDELGSLVQVFNQLMERLETLFKTQQRLLGDVSHELRTPLTAMRGNIDLMRRIGADPDLLDSTEMEMDRLTRLVTDLLSLARAEVGGLPIREEEVALDMIFLHTFEQMQHLDSPVKLVLRGLDQARVMGDPDRLKQLVINLITNGMKYTDAGGSVWISLLCDGDEAVITVEDSGIGIPAEDLPNIFNRFYRVNRARTRQRGGAGLGLAIVKSIVDAHEGTITVESEVGVGTKFEVRLPLLESADYAFLDDEFELER